MGRDLQEFQGIRVFYLGGDAGFCRHFDHRLHICLEKRSFGMGVETLVGKNILMDIVDNVVNWGRKWSIWPVTFGLA